MYLCCCFACKMLETCNWGHLSEHLAIQGDLTFLKEHIRIPLWDELLLDVRLNIYSVFWKKPLVVFERFRAFCGFSFGVFGLAGGNGPAAWSLERSLGSIWSAARLEKAKRRQILPQVLRVRDGKKGRFSCDAAWILGFKSAELMIWDIPWPGKEEGEADRHSRRGAI